VLEEIIHVNLVDRVDAKLRDHFIPSNLLAYSTFGWRHLGTIPATAAPVKQIVRCHADVVPADFSGKVTRQLFIE
jgi:hypothetical protein